MCLPLHSSARTAQWLRLLNNAHAINTNLSPPLPASVLPTSLPAPCSLMLLTSAAQMIMLSAMMAHAESTKITAQHSEPVLQATTSAQISNALPARASALPLTALAHHQVTLSDSSNAGINLVLLQLTLAQQELPAQSLDKSSVKAPALTLLLTADNQLNASVTLLLDALMALALTRPATAQPPRLAAPTKPCALMVLAETTVLQLPCLPEEESSLTALMPNSALSSAHPVMLFLPHTTVLHHKFVVAAKSNALTVHALLTFHHAHNPHAQLAPSNVGMANARLLSPDAPPELPAQKNFQLSALTDLARPLPLNALHTLAAHSSSHSDAVQVNAEPERKTAQLWSLAHLPCQLSAQMKAVSETRYTVPKLLLLSVLQDLSDVLMAHALLPNTSAQLSLHAHQV
mmetsp:Transcript_34182/g.39875  ORF Transcript_34182/g.39875 Transcript_34182/m.39875 type:complete len:403 (+) Transcript_34182:1865-3073(+)